MTKKTSYNNRKLIFRSNILEQKIHGRTLNNKLRYEGQVFDTNFNGKLIITEFQNANNIKVKFIGTGYETVTYLTQITNGHVRDWSLARVYGVGIIDKPVIKGSSNHTKQPHYKTWNSMLQRCYDEKLHTVRPTYKGCSVSDEFKSFSKFSFWAEKQIGANSVDDVGRPFHLDKDILVKGNKVYSPDTCCFVPHDINTQFTMSKGKRGDLPVGVSKRKNSLLYRAQIKSDGVVKCLGNFKTVEDAFYAYKTAKESYIKSLANKWRDQIDPRVYEALLRYEVEMTD